MEKEGISLVISGQISDRLSANGVNLENIIQSFILFKKTNEQNEIIVSTYINQTPQELIKYIDRLIINEDPGPDMFRVSPWPIGPNSKRNLHNWTRFYNTTYSGVKAAKNRIVIKTRIEILPKIDSQFFNFYEEVMENFQQESIPKLGFFIEHYTGIFFSLDGQLGHIPGMLQIGEKKVLENLWLNAMEFWIKNNKILTRRIIRHPLTGEQILGFVFLNMYCNFPLLRKLFMLRKYYISRDLIKSTLIAEKNNFVYFEYKKSGFSNYVYPGTIEIKTPDNLYSQEQTNLGRRLVIILLKRVKHLSRRYYQGFKEKSWLKG